MTTLKLAPRKQPRQRRSEATVDAVIEAAARVLEKEGLEGYNTNVVAQAAGISVGSLYQYFPNKDAITRVLIRREAAALIAQLERIAQQRGGGSAVGRVVAAIVDHLMLRSNLARILDVEEQRLVLQQEVRGDETTATMLLKKCLFQDVPDSERVSIMLLDIISIMRGMVDGAGARGETDRKDLKLRVERAVEGYLNASLAD